MSGKVEILEDGSEVHYTDEGKFWYFIPLQEVEQLKKLNKIYQKKLTNWMWRIKEDANS